MFIFRRRAATAAGDGTPSLSPSLATSSASSVSVSSAASSSRCLLSDVHTSAARVWGSSSVPRATDASRPEAANAAANGSATAAFARANFAFAALLRAMGAAVSSSSRGGAFPFPFGGPLSASPFDDGPAPPDPGPAARASSTTRERFFPSAVSRAASRASSGTRRPVGRLSTVSASGEYAPCATSSATPSRKLGPNASITLFAYAPRSARMSAGAR